MNLKFRIPLLCMIFFVGVFLLAPQINAAKPIATVSSFAGDVLVQTDVRVVKLTAIGLELNTGDRLQTLQGEAQITFDDGAVMKLRPFSNVMIEQGDEGRAQEEGEDESEKEHAGGHRDRDDLVGDRPFLETVETHC